MSHSIPFIHNYCNRWCERCPLGHRCSVNMAEKDFERYFENPGSEEIEQEFLADDGPEEDSPIPDEVFDIEEPTAEEMEIFRKQQEELRAKVDAHPLVRASAEAGDCIELVVERYQKLFKGIRPESHEGLTWQQQQKVEGEGHRLQNFIDVLTWYRYTLEVKTRRAVSGLLADDFLEDDPIQNDSNGTAKVAKIGAGHCFKAAEGLLRAMPALEDEALLLLQNLKTFQKVMDKTFPRADDFIRPGFDTLGVSEDLGL